MCSFCKNVDTCNDFHPIMNADIGAGALGTIVQHLYLRKGSKDLTPTITLVAYLNNNLVCEQSTEIKFCPICGRNVSSH